MGELYTNEENAQVKISSKMVRNQPHSPQSRPSLSGCKTHSDNQVLYGVVPGTAGEAVGKQDWEMAEAGMDNDLSTFYRTLDLKTN